jgi:formylglycine-generating enzyme required for sulfatase activity
VGRSRLCLVAAVSTFVAGASCDRGSTLAAPQGKVVVVVDTDAPVPALVSRLRVDLYETDETWYASRDVPAYKPADWPLSFVVDLADGDPARDVLVRLRAYPESKVRDYLGERYTAPTDPTRFCTQSACYQSGPIATLPSCCPTAPPPTVLPFATTGCVACPRMLDPSQNDVTPPSEPQPALTIDTLLLVHVEPGTTKAARVTLRGACFGTMADLYDGQACTDTANVLVPVDYAPLDADTSVPAPSQLVGKFGVSGDAAQCTVTPRAAGTAPDGTPLHDDDACVPGGTFVYGSRSAAIGDASDDLPERPALVQPFLMDRHEVTVARYRKAVAAGWTGGSSTFANEGPLVGTGASTTVPQCTWSATDRGREEYPVNCITHDAARSLCRFDGRDLPLEVQWEYAAAQAGRPARTFYPWGNGNGRPPDCRHIVYGRSDSLPGTTDVCSAQGYGPATVTTSDGGDVTPLGIVGLGGSLSEWTVDSFASPSAGCWAAAGLVQPSCTTGGPNVAVRGGTWSTSILHVLATSRVSKPAIAISSSIGFRCVRPGRSS